MGELTRPAARCPAQGGISLSSGGVLLFCCWRKSEREPRSPREERGGCRGGGALSPPSRKKTSASTGPARPADALGGPASRMAPMKLVLPLLPPPAPICLAYASPLRPWGCPPHVQPARSPAPSARRREKGGGHPRRPLTRARPNTTTFSSPSPASLEPNGLLPPPSSPLPLGINCPMCWVLLIAPANTECGPLAAFPLTPPRPCQRFLFRPSSLYVLACAKSGTPLGSFTRPCQCEPGWRDVLRDSASPAKIRGELRREELSLNKQ